MSASLTVCGVGGVPCGGMHVARLPAISAATHVPARGAATGTTSTPAGDAGVVELARHLRRVRSGLGDPQLERGRVTRDRQRVRCAAAAGEDVAEVL